MITLNSNSFFTDAEIAVIKKAVVKHSAKVHPQTLEIIIKKMGEIRKKYTDMSFIDVRRNALNDCHIKDKKVRRAYNSALGAYFGRRGGLIRASKRVRGIPSRVEEKGIIPSKLGAGGQLELMV